MINQMEYDFLKRICYLDHKNGRYYSINHIAVDADSEEYQLATDLSLRRIIKVSGPESKTGIKVGKLDPTKTWIAFYIGGGCTGHRDIEEYERFLGMRANTGIQFPVEA